MAARLTHLLLSLLLIANGCFLIMNKFDEKPMALFTRMATLTKSIVDITPVRIHSDSITLGLGVLYCLLGAGVLIGNKLSNVCLIFVSFFTAATIDNPLFSKPEYSKACSLLTHLLIIGVAFENLKHIRGVGPEEADLEKIKTE